MKLTKFIFKSILFTVLSLTVLSETPAQITAGGCTKADLCQNVTCLENQTCIDALCYCNDVTATNYEALGECQYDLCANVVCEPCFTCNPETGACDPDCPDGVGCNEDGVCDNCVGVNCAENEICVDAVCLCNDPNACNYQEVAPCVFSNTDDCLDCDEQTTCETGFVCDGNGNCVTECVDCTSVEDVASHITYDCTTVDNENFVTNITTDLCGDFGVEWTYNGTPSTELPITYTTSSVIDIVLIFDNSQSSEDAGYKETQQQAILDFMARINNGEIFSDCESVRLSIIPHGKGQGGQCNTPLSSSPCIPDDVSDCLCYTDLVDVQENYADLVDYVNAITVTSSTCSACSDADNNDIGALGTADNLLMGSVNANIVYMTDYRPYRQTGTFDCADAADCCGTVLTELQTLQQSYNVFGVGLGDDMSPLNCVNFYGSNEAWLNEAINGDATDNNNVFQISNPDTNFDLGELVDVLSTNTLAITIDVCGETINKVIDIPRCSSECPVFVVESCTDPSIGYTSNQQCVDGVANFSFSFGSQGEVYLISDADGNEKPYTYTSIAGQNRYYVPIVNGTACYFKNRVSGCVYTVPFWDGILTNSGETIINCP